MKLTEAEKSRINDAIKQRLGELNETQNKHKEVAQAVENIMLIAEEAAKADQAEAFAIIGGSIESMLSCLSPETRQLILIKLITNEL